MTKAYEYNKRWRQRNPDKRHRGKARYYAKTQGAPNTRKMWTDAETRTLIEWTGTDTELAAKLGRSVEAIQHRRTRISDRPTSDFGVGMDE